MGKKIKKVTPEYVANPEWMPLYKFPKNIYVVSKRKPVSIFEKLEEVYAYYFDVDGASISDVAVSEKTDTRIRKAAHEYIKIKHPMLPARKIQGDVGMAMLNMGPVELDDPRILDDTLYVRLDAIRSGRIRIK
jgi:hypothetical protein